MLRRRALIALAVVGLALLAAMLPSEGTMRDGGTGMVSFQFAGSEQRAQEVLEGWGDDGRAAARRSLWIDFGFAAAYGAFLALAALAIRDLGVRRDWRRLATVGTPIAALAVSAASFDCLENACLLVVLGGHPEAALPATLLAGAKFVALVPVVLYVLAGVAARLARPRRSVGPVGEPRAVAITPGGRERLDELGPVWSSLQEHHARITPDLGGVAPKRELADAWRRRRAKYERWLEDADSFFLVAETDRRPIGYAFVTVGLGHASWRSGDRVAELETLSVLPEHRGRGVGTALLNAVWGVLAARGVSDLSVTATTTNIDAHRFYERHGLKETFTIFYGRAPR